MAARRSPPSPQVARLRERVRELEETLEAIRGGEVDALVVGRGGKRLVFTLEGADSPFRRIVEQMGEGALTIRPDGTILYCNRRFARLVGRRQETVTGAPLAAFMTEGSKAAFDSLLRSAARRPARGELMLAGPKAKAFPALVSMSSLQDSRVPALCVSVADLSAHKRQAELSAFSAELERRVETRTAELTDAVRELEAFSYSASHDLKGPLRSIMGFGELLERSLKERLREEEAGYLSRIREATARMARIIESLLALSRASRGELLHEQVDLSALAQEVAAELRDAQPGSAVRFRSEPRLVVSGDPRLLRQLLQNLLSNAWRFSKPGAGARVEFGRRGAAFQVKDNGIGFDPAYAEKIFEPFQRLHPEVPGAGIGLALAKRIVERHGGRLWAEGKPGAGAAFFFTLRSDGSSRG